MRSMAQHSLGSAVMIAMATGAFVLWSSREHQTQSVSCLVSTTNGEVQGMDLGASCAFLSIPFAAPPIGSLRWKPPQPAAPWAPETWPGVSAGTRAHRARDHLDETRARPIEHGGLRLRICLVMWIESPFVE